MDSWLVWIVGLIDDLIDSWLDRKIKDMKINDRKMVDRLA